MNTLACLRIFGPIELHAVAVRLNVRALAVANEAEALLAGGLIHNPSGYLWDLTDAGRDEFTKQMEARRESALMLSTLRRRDAACEGVR